MKTILARLYQRTAEHRGLAIAAGVTFYGLLAIFPATAALVSLFGLFADPALVSKQLNGLANFLPSGATQIIGEQVDRIASQGSGKLSLTFILSLTVSLWSANAGVKALFDALNVVYRQKEKRSFIKLNLISLGFTLLALFMLLLAIGATVVIPIVLNFFDIQGIGALALVRWPLLLINIALVLACLYRWGPSRTTAQWQWISWGSAFASLGWVVTTLLFSWYVQNFGSYNKTYGSLGAAVGFMTWLWLSTIVILLGAELDAILENGSDDKDVAINQASLAGG